jgi:hypothetical protein
MLDHVGFSVRPSKFDSIIAYYTAALAPLGASKQMEIPGVVIGFGPDKRNIHFWIAAKEDAKEAGMHIAFGAKNHDIVDQFHAEALKAGGTCNGKPGIRENYHPNYYAAFVIDPVGYVSLARDNFGFPANCLSNNIEIVDHVPH